MVLGRPNVIAAEAGTVARPLPLAEPPPINGRDLVRLEAVHRRFGSTAALDGVDLSVTRGEIFGIIGRSGAGKSTLIRTINGLERIDAGRVILTGIDVSHLHGKALNHARRNVGMIFQHFNLLAMKTVFENVELPLKLGGRAPATRALAVRRLLDLVGLRDKEHAYPARLSGGQKQRVGIARALVSGPSLLLCDEATSALDPETTLSILRLLKELNTTLGVTIILITHEMSVIREICDRVAILDQGRILEQGPVWKVFSQPQNELTRRLLRTVRPPLPEVLQRQLRDTPAASGRLLLRIVTESLDRHAEILPLLAGAPWLAQIQHAEVDRIAAHAVGTVTFSICYRGEKDHAALEVQLDRLSAHYEILGYVAG
jgi:D-methionine transport system ATP-binding protein